MKVRETKTPGIPDIRDDNVVDVLRAIKSTLEVREGRSGDPLDEHVTYRHLEALGLADSTSPSKDSSGGGSLPVGPPGGGGPGGGYGYPPNYNPSTDLSIPPQPTNLKVKAGFVAFYLDWDGAPYRNHAYTEVWRNGRDDLGSAIFVGISVTNVFTDPAEPDTTNWYWIRFVSQANVTGPWNLTSGTSGHTAIDVGKIIDALSKELVGSPLWGSLTQRIGQIEADSYVANRSLQSDLSVLESRVNTNAGRLVELHSVTQNQATLLTQLEARGSSAGNRTYFTPERPDAATPGTVNGVTLNAGDVWYDTDDANRSYRWSGADWVEFITSNGQKVYHQASDPASFDGTDWVDVDGRVMRDGDLWFDSDDGDRQWLWTNDTHSWLDLSTGDNSASIITLEQTKIGYATLNVNSPLGPAGAVFDNAGAIWNNVANGDPNYANSAQFWNSTHSDILNSDSKVTWHIGLPFAQATKQVGISTDGGTSVVTLQQQFTTMQAVDTSLLAQYTVKIDVNGYVTGFGLAANGPASAPTSMFIVNADKFAIGPAMPANFYGAGTTYAKNDIVKMNGGNPLATHVFQSRQPNNLNHTPVFGAFKAEVDPWWMDLTARLPFITTTSNTVIDGKTYPPGVWMNTANIADATIKSAQIGDLVADTITTGELKATIGIKTGKIYGGVALGQPIASPTYGKGFFLGDDGGTLKFYVGSADVSYVLWDGTNFVVQGKIYGTAGFIGGINMAWDSVAKHGQLFSTGVTAFNAGSGFWLDDTSRFRVGNPQGARIEWDGAGIGLYDKNNIPIIAAGGGIAWSGISGPPPSSIANATITINSNGTLNNAGGGQVTATGVGAVRTDLTNAPSTILNQSIHVSSSKPGQITLTGAGAGTIDGVVMPGWKIDAINVGTYFESAAITQAYIGLLAVGAAQIVDATITGAKIANLAVDTLNIAGNAVVVPSSAGPYPATGTETITTTQAFLFGNNPAKAVLQFVLNQPAPMITVIYTTELSQGPGNSGASVELVCYLYTNGNTNIASQRFTLGIINNAPKYSQTAMFNFANVPANTNLVIRITGQQVAGAAGQTNLFGKQIIMCIATKK